MILADTGLRLICGKPRTDEHPCIWAVVDETLHSLHDLLG
jgi:hypothetical protein